MAASLEKSLKALGAWEYRLMILISAPLAAERRTEEPPTQLRNWISPDARAAVWSAPLVIVE